MPASLPPVPDDDEPRERRVLLDVVTRDLGLKALALVIAVILWLLVGVR